MKIEKRWSQLLRWFYLGLVHLRFTQINDGHTEETCSPSQKLAIKMIQLSKHNLKVKFGYYCCIRRYAYK